MNTVQRLRTVPLFSELPTEDLERLSVGIEEVHLPAGALLFSEGDRGDRAFVVLEGQIEIVKATVGGEVLLAVQSEGVVGEMALLEDAPRNASVRARSDVTLLAIPKARLDELLESSPSASRAFFEVMLGRWRATQASLQQSERMAQLGTLTAGLAHELNNPAAAVNRSAGQLPEAIERYGHARAAVALELGEANSPFLENLLESTRRRSGGTIPLSALERADLEDDVEAWLADHHVDRSWELAPGLVDAGITVDRLSDVADHVESSQLEVVIALIGAAQEQLALVYQIEEGTRRMSAIVKALKSYAYLDQAPVQNVDVTAGLDDTLMLLEHKTKDIEVLREYADDLPRADVLAKEFTSRVRSIGDAYGYSEQELRAAQYAGNN
ncbi:MAG: cyclic nucleotide-binding domain-containing protein, partial [Acidimicrobiia bacterium]|nr:cyclic nucleotide-binding domain-containing protein [Acidimicrobiia bacterium]